MAWNINNFVEFTVKCLQFESVEDHQPQSSVCHQRNQKRTESAQLRALKKKKEKKRKKLGGESENVIWKSFWTG